MCFAREELEFSTSFRDGRDLNRCPSVRRIEKKSSQFA